jgi:hypothetical protein
MEAYYLDAEMPIQFTEYLTLFELRMSLLNH